MSRYGVTTETKEGGNSRMPAGINTNVSLVSADFTSPRNDGTGDPVIILQFQGAAGTHKHIEWAVNDDKVTEFAKNNWNEAAEKGETPKKRDKKPYSSLDEYIEAQLDYAYATFNSRLKHIAHAFEKDEQKIVFQGESYADVAKAFVAFLEARKASTQVDIKLTLDKKGENTGFPPFPRFIQPAGTSPSSLVITKYDRIGTTSKPDMESAASSLGVEEEEPEF